jgi:hypothetical protein
METYDRKTLFEICVLCNGSGILPDELVSMGQCICQGSGYVSSGLTTSQFELYKQRAEDAESKLATRGICPRCEREELAGGMTANDEVYASCPTCGWGAVIA